VAVFTLPPRHISFLIKGETVMFYSDYFSTRLRLNRRDAAQSVPLQHGKKIPVYWIGVKPLCPYTG